MSFARYDFQVFMLVHPVNQPIPLVYCPTITIDPFKGTSKNLFERVSSANFVLQGKPTKAGWEPVEEV
jgi:hypothetical protein